MACSNGNGYGSSQGKGYASTLNSYGVSKAQSSAGYSPKSGSTYAPNSAKDMLAPTTSLALYTGIKLGEEDDETRRNYSSLEYKIGNTDPTAKVNDPYALAKKGLNDIYENLVKAYGEVIKQVGTYLKSSNYSEEGLFGASQAKVYAMNNGGSIDELVSGGAIVGNDGKMILGEKEKAGEANAAKRMYQNFLESNVGKKLVEYMTKNGYKKPDIDGYGFLKLGKNVAAAVLKTNHPKYKTLLAVNKDIYDGLDNTVKEYVLAHETLHAGDPESGTNSDKAHLERKTDGNLKTFYKKMAEKVNGSLKNVYQSLSNLAQQREASPQIA